MRRDKEAFELELAEMRERWRKVKGTARHPNAKLAHGSAYAAAQAKRQRVAAMYRAGASTSDIAAALSMTTNSVRNQLRRAGVPLRSYSEAVKLAWAQRETKFLSRKERKPQSATAGKLPDCQWEWCGVNGRLCSDCAESA